LRFFVSEILVLKTRSDRVVRERWTRTKLQLWWTQTSLTVREIQEILGMSHRSCGAPNYRCRQILRAIRLFEGDRSAKPPRIGQQEGNDLPPQRPATHIFTHPRKAIRVFLECFAALSVLILFHRIIIFSALFKILLREKISQICH